jgi:ArsR family transcriptional regulator
MKPFLRVMKALSDSNRIKIIKLLEQKEMCVCEITAALGLAQPTVSKHLKILEDAELITSRKDASWVNYRLAPDDNHPYQVSLLRLIKTWLNDEKDITELINRLDEFDRAKLKV